MLLKGGEGGEGRREGGRGVADDGRREAIELSERIVKESF